MAKTPRELVEGAARWIARDYGDNCQFLRLVNLCERASNSGLKRIRRGDVYILAQQAGLSVTECEDFRFDNSLWAPLSRYMLMYRPALSVSIHPKGAAIDSVDFVEVWDEIVGAGDLKAKSWRKAKAGVAA